MLRLNLEFRLHFRLLLLNLVANHSQQVLHQLGRQFQRREDLLALRERVFERKPRMLVRRM